MKIITKVLGKITIISLLFAFFYPVNNAGASLYKVDNEYIQTTESAEINWSAMTVRATGVVSYEDLEVSDTDWTIEEFARSYAIKNAISALKEIPISSKYLIDDMMFLYEDINKKVEDASKNAYNLGEPEYIENKSVKIPVELDIKGEILDAIYPQKKELPDGEGGIFQGRGKYTSIIFDASSTDFQMILLPKIIDDEDKVYYTLTKKNRDNAVKRGFVKYFNSLAAAKGSRFSGKTPYVITKVKVDKYDSQTLIVPFNILDKARNDAFYSEILRNCKVIIIVK